MDYLGIEYRLFGYSISIENLNNIFIGNIGTLQNWSTFLLNSPRIKCELFSCYSNYLVLIDRCDNTLSDSQLSGAGEKAPVSEEFLKDLDDEVLFPLNRTNRFKSPKEVKFLEEQFARDPTWSRETVQICK